MVVKKLGEWDSVGSRTCDLLGAHRDGQSVRAVRACASSRLCSYTHSADLYPLFRSFFLSLFLISLSPPSSPFLLAALSGYGAAVVTTDETNAMNALVRQ